MSNRNRREPKMGIAGQFLSSIGLITSLILVVMAILALGTGDTEEEARMGIHATLLIGLLIFFISLKYFKTEKARLLDTLRDYQDYSKTERKKKRIPKKEAPTKEDPLKILKLRLAKGEITKKEFREMKRALEE